MVGSVICIFQCFTCKALGHSNCLLSLFIALLFFCIEVFMGLCVCLSVSPARSCPVPACVWVVPPSSALCSAVFPDHVRRNPQTPAYPLPYETRDTVNTGPGDLNIRRSGHQEIWTSGHPSVSRWNSRCLCYPDLEELLAWRTSDVGNVRSEKLFVSLPTSKHGWR